MIYVVGCNHRAQRTDIQGVWEEAAMLDAEVKNADELARANLASRLKEIIAANNITRIAEEDHPTRKYIGQALAEEYGKPYVPVTLRLEERRRRGIPDDYTRTPTAKTEAYKLFEEHFRNQVLTNKAPEDNVLVIVGHTHMAPLAELFRSTEQAVVAEPIGAIEDNDC